jgi:hypothetical protein
MILVRDWYTGHAYKGNQRHHFGVFLFGFIPLYLRSKRI